MIKNIMLLPILLTYLLRRFSNYTSRLPRTWLASEGPLYGVTIANSSQVVEHMGIARGHQG